MTTTVVCLAHRQPTCLICNPKPAAEVAEQRRNVWHKDGAGWVRHDADGTQWTITRAVAGGVDLTLTYREHRLRSHHPNVTAAKRHRTDMVNAWQAQSLRSWIGQQRLTDIVERAHAALAGVTPGPWEHHTAPSEGSSETPAEYMANTLIGDGEPLHVLTAASTDPKFAYLVPALTGDGPTSAINAAFVAQARTLVPELATEVEQLRETLQAVERFARVQALSDRVRTGPESSTHQSEERYWLDLLAIVERRGA